MIETTPTWRMVVSPGKGTFHLAAEAADADVLPPGAPIGEVASTARPHPVTALHGGQVVEWLVEDGDLVSPGQPLLRLHPEATPLMAALTTTTGAPHAAILGIGAYRPVRLVPNADVVDAIDSSDEWIQQRSGIKTRRWAGPEESVQMMSVEASRIALERAGLDASQIDCVVVATVSHLLQTPAVATAIAHELGTDQAAAFDISAACSGFCHGISLASDFVRAGSARHVLVIGVERLTDILDLTDRGTAFIFADGAGAAVVGPSDTPGIGPVVWGSDGEQFDLIRQREDWRDVVGSPEVPGSGVMPHLVMQGNPVFRWASFAMAKIGQQALDAAGITLDELDVFVPAPGQHAHHRRDGPLDEAAQHGADRPRRRRPGQHLGRVGPARARPDDRRGRGQVR